MWYSGGNEGTLARAKSNSVSVFFAAILAGLVKCGGGRRRNLRTRLPADAENHSNLRHPQNPERKLQS